MVSSLALACLATFGGLGVFLPQAAWGQAMGHAACFGTMGAGAVFSLITGLSGIAILKREREEIHSPSRPLPISTASASPMEVSSPPAVDQASVAGTIFCLRSRGQIQTDQHDQLQLHLGVKLDPWSMINEVRIEGDASSLGISTLPEYLMEQLVEDGEVLFSWDGELVHLTVDEMFSANYTLATSQLNGMQAPLYYSDLPEGAVRFYSLSDMLMPNQPLYKWDLQNKSFVESTCEHAREEILEGKTSLELYNLSNNSSHTLDDFTCIQSIQLDVELEASRMEMLDEKASSSEYKLIFEFPGALENQKVDLYLQGAKLFLQVARTTLLAEIPVSSKSPEAVPRPSYFNQDVRYHEIAFSQTRLGPKFPLVKYLVANLPFSYVDPTSLDLQFSTIEHGGCGLGIHILSVSILNSDDLVGSDSDEANSLGEFGQSSATDKSDLSD